MKTKLSLATMFPSGIFTTHEGSPLGGEMVLPVATLFVELVAKWHCFLRLMKRVYLDANRVMLVAPLGPKWH